MKGPELFKIAVRSMADVTLKVADQVKLDFERASIGRIVPAAGDKESSA